MVERTSPHAERREVWSNVCVWSVSICVQGDMDAGNEAGCFRDVSLAIVVYSNRDRIHPIPSIAPIMIATADGSGTTVIAIGVP